MAADSVLFGFAIPIVMDDFVTCLLRCAKKHTAVGPFLNAIKLNVEEMGVQYHTTVASVLHYLFNHSLPSSVSLPSSGLKSFRVLATPLDLPVYTHNRPSRSLVKQGHSALLSPCAAVRSDIAHVGQVRSLLIYAFQGREIPGLHDLHGLYIMLPGVSRIICMT